MNLIPLSTIDLSSDHLMLTYELLAAGYDDRALTRMVRAGMLHRLRQGAYVAGEYWRHLDQVERRKLVALATLRAARSQVALAGPSAADAFGVPVWDMGDDVHLLRLDHRSGRRKGGKVQHHGQVLAEDLT